MTVNMDRSVHVLDSTRLWNTDLLDAVREAAPDFQPPQTAMDGRSAGLCYGEQDRLAFLVDPLVWVEIDGDAFALGFFVGNSEVGRRSLGGRLSGCSRFARITSSWIQSRSPSSAANMRQTPKTVCSRYATWSNGWSPAPMLAAIASRQRSRRR